MDFLNKAYGQITDLFASMTPAARITTGLLVAVISVSLLFLFRQQAETADVLVFGGETLTSDEIANMSTALSQEDLNGWDTEGNRLRVPRGKRHTYLAALAKHNALPQNSGSAYEKVINDHNPFENRKMGDLRARYALEKDLAYTIREFAGIDAAAVKIQEIRDDASFASRPKRRAAVTVKASGTASLDAMQIRMIRDVVAFGGGVDQSDVVVVDTNGHRSYMGPPKDDEISGDQNAYADTQRFWEQEFKRKIVDKLSVYPNTNVEVYVELDPTLEDRTTQLKYDEKPTPLKTRTASTDERSVTSPHAGRPGVESNIGNRAIAVSNSPETENTITESVEETESAAGVTHQITRKSPLGPKLVTASIGVPKSYFKQVWKQQNPTPEGDIPAEPSPTELQAVEAQVIAEIEAAVVQLIPKAPAGEDTFPRVKVTPYTDLPMEEPPVPGFADNAGAWFASNWQTLAMLGVALFGVIFLRGMIQSTQDSTLAAVENKTETAQHMTESQQSDEGDLDEDEDGDAFGNSLRGRFQTSGRSLRDELTELVREDPDGAASVLQNWITQANSASERQPLNA